MSHALGAIADLLVTAYFALAMLWPFAFLFGVLAMVAYVSNALWLDHLRRLLERRGLRVRQLKRVWLRRRFAGRTPLARGEWLAEVLVEDHDGRLRSGWVRWRRLWPWDTDRWAIEWDETPTR